VFNANHEPFPNYLNPTSTIIPAALGVSAVQLSTLHSDVISDLSKYPKCISIPSIIIRNSGNNYNFDNFLCLFKLLTLQ
jgi:hypothetical protein